MMVRVVRNGLVTMMAMVVMMGMFMALFVPANRMVHALPCAVRVHDVLPFGGCGELPHGKSHNCHGTGDKKRLRPLSGTNFMYVVEVLFGEGFVLMAR